VEDSSSLELSRFCTSTQNSAFLHDIIASIIHSLFSSKWSDSMAQGLKRNGKALARAGVWRRVYADCGVGMISAKTRRYCKLRKLSGEFNDTERGVSKPQSRRFVQSGNDIERLNARPSSTFAKIVERRHQTHLSPVGAGENEQVEPVCQSRVFYG
jgi:hypothetical protein